MSKDRKYEKKVLLWTALVIVINVVAGVGVSTGNISVGFGIYLGSLMGILLGSLLVDLTQRFKEIRKGGCKPSDIDEDQ